MIMATVDVLTATGTKSGSVELPAEIFEAHVNIPLMHQIVVAQLAAARQGTADVKTKNEVSGGGRKPYKQKGTGNARQGSIRAPQYRGGGIVHGPTPRKFDQRTPKKMKFAALRSALSDRASNGRVHVVASFIDGDAPSTKSAMKVLAALTDRKKTLVILDRADNVTWLSLRNLPNVHILVPDQLNVYDILNSDDLVFTSKSLEAFLEHAAARTGSSKGDE